MWVGSLVGSQEHPQSQDNSTTQIYGQSLLFLAELHAAMDTTCHCGVLCGSTELLSDLTLAVFVGGAFCGPLCSC